MKHPIRTLASSAALVAAIAASACSGNQAAPPMAVTAPVSPAPIARTQPAVALRPDAFDAPAASAIAEAAKGARGMSDSMEMTPPPPAPQQQPQPPAAHHHHGGGAP